MPEAVLRVDLPRVLGGIHRELARGGRPQLELDLAAGCEWALGLKLVEEWPTGTSVDGHTHGQSGEAGRAHNQEMLNGHHGALVGVIVGPEVHDHLGTVAPR